MALIDKINQMVFNYDYRDDSIYLSQVSERRSG